MESIAFFVENKSVFVIAHVVSVIAGMGAAVVSDILFNFYARDRFLSAAEIRALDRLSRTVWISLAAIILSGVAIFLSDPAYYMTSAKFLIKMTVVAVLAINGFALARFVSPHLTRKFLRSPAEAPTRRIAFACGAVSVVSWFSALVLGLLDSIPFSYAAALFIYIGVIVCAIACALVIEWHTFERKIKRPKDLV